MQSEKDLEVILKEGIKMFSSELNDAQIGDLLKYKDLMLEWNKKVNLTSIEDEREIIIKHYLDSFSILPYIKDENLRVIDVGSGAGFPGIPIKIAYSRINVVLLDSLDKRLKFLNEVIKTLQLKDIRTVHGRAEDFGVMNDFREKFDVSVARAVSSLPVILEYCLPFVKVGGIFIAMKGSNIGELEQGKKALDILGGEIESVSEIALPFSDIRRNIIIIKKLRQTPTRYPRKAGKPSKEPLI